MWLQVFLSHACTEVLNGYLSSKRCYKHVKIFNFAVLLVLFHSIKYYVNLSTFCLKKLISTFKGF